MNEEELKGIFHALLVAAFLSVATFFGIMLFSSERSAQHVPTPAPLPLEFKDADELNSLDQTGRKIPAGETNRNERAKPLFQWGR
ncbi:MAG: hypothetical protein HY692_10010 [Cyanobacteria bacterium NC_groundwater_1444_Ag_S-0.65um_54_12]|nr:hypothetical protein [Cyanobacteria bacterium NC_groundwater_1444_Ag_S-0.65um_54_12]